LTSLLSYSLDDSRFPHQRASRADKGVCVSKLHQDARLTMGYMEFGAGIVVSDYDQTAGHRFQGYVSKGFGFAWEEKYVGGRIIFAELFAHTHTGKNQIRIFFLQASAKRSVTHKDKLDPIVGALDRTVRFDGHGEILFSRYATDID